MLQKETNRAVNESLIILLNHCLIGATHSFKQKPKSNPPNPRVPKMIIPITAVVHLSAVPKRSRIRNLADNYSGLLFPKRQRRKFSFQMHSENSISNDF